MIPTHDPTEDAMNFDEETVEKTLRLWAGIPFSGVPVHDPTAGAMNFDEETFEKTLRLWAGIPFSGVPVQSRRVWHGFGDDHAPRFAEETVEEHSFPRSFPAEAAYHPRTKKIKEQTLYRHSAVPQRNPYAPTELRNCGTCTRV
jgi:hypothetical protein